MPTACTSTQPKRPTRVGGLQVGQRGNTVTFRCHEPPRAVPRGWSACAESVCPFKCCGACMWGAGHAPRMWCRGKTHGECKAEPRDVAPFAALLLAPLRLGALSCGSIDWGHLWLGHTPIGEPWPAMLLTSQHRNWPLLLLLAVV